MKQCYSSKNNAMKIRLLTLTLLTFLVGGNMAWAWIPPSAGTYRLRSRGTSGNNFDVYNAAGTSTVATNQSAIEAFNITSGTYRLIFENTRTIKMTGQIYVNAEIGTQAHLIMELGTTVTHTADNPTLKISSNISGNGQAMAFYIPKRDNANNTQHTITIKGNPAPAGSEDPMNFSYNFANNFVIDGDGPTLTLVDGDTWNPKVSAGNDGSVRTNGLVRIQEGSLTLENVTVQKFSTSYGNAGLVQVFPDYTDAAVKIKFDHCYFYQIGAKSSAGSPVIRMQGNNAAPHNNNRSAEIRNCKFEDIFGAYNLTVGQTKQIDNANATIRTIGNNKTTLAIYTHTSQKTTDVPCAGMVAALPRV